MSPISLHIVKVFVGSRVDEVLLRVQFTNSTSGLCFRKGILTVQMPVVHGHQGQWVERQEEDLNVCVGEDTKECRLGLRFIDSSGRIVGQGILHMKTGEISSEEAFYQQLTSGEICEQFCDCHGQSETAMSWEDASHESRSFAEPMSVDLNSQVGNDCASSEVTYKVEKVFGIDTITQLFNLKSSSVTVNFSGTATAKFG